MKLKLFNGEVRNIACQIMAGGYDEEAGAVIFMVRDGDKCAGTLTVAVGEAAVMRDILTKGVPIPKAVEAPKEITKDRAESAQL